MASNRHLGRIIVLQTLYEQEIRQTCEDSSFDLEEVLRRNIRRYKNVIEDTDFIEQLTLQITKRQDELDKMLQPIAPEWPIDQIARMDRLVLRIGAYELLHEQDVPDKVVINEAIELAKSFGGENSSKFINGVLGTLLKSHQQTSEKKKQVNKSNTKKTSATKKQTAKKPTKKSSTKKATKKASIK